MITLCGIHLSNYYSKVKMALLEKNIPFTEEKVGTGGKDEAVLSATPLGKIPFIRTEHGPLCESQVILDYLEAAYPTPSLMPADPYAAAKVHEIITFIELHMELVARQLYKQAFFGGTVDQAVKDSVRAQLAKSIPAFKRLAKFSPYIAGSQFTQADCAAYASLALVGMATKSVLGEDMLADAGIDVRSYMKMLGERPSAQRIAADRKASMPAKT